jgi:hypothetical protein
MSSNSSPAMFTRRHYEAVARALSAARVAAGPKRNPNLHEIEAALAWLFEEDNERFDRRRFFEACEAGLDGCAA